MIYVQQLLVSFRIFIYMAEFTNNQFILMNFLIVFIDILALRCYNCRQSMNLWCKQCNPILIVKHLILQNHQFSYLFLRSSKLILPISNIHISNPQKLIKILNFSLQILNFMKGPLKLNHIIFQTIILIILLFQNQIKSLDLLRKH